VGYQTLHNELHRGRRRCIGTTLLQLPPRSVDEIFIPVFKGNQVKSFVWGDGSFIYKTFLTRIGGCIEKYIIEIITGPKVNVFDNCCHGTPRQV